MRTIVLCTAVVLLGSAAWGAPEQLVPAGDFILTKLPFTYILDYNDGDYFGGSYEKYHVEGPPGLLHMGTVTPAHSYFGPAHDSAAAQGKRAFPPIGTFVQQYRDRLAEAQRLNDQLRKQGVGQVVAYVCLMTTGGDPDKRTGFWHFYDNWEAFTPLGAGPKPADDPVLWQQRKPDGSEHHFYTREHYLPMFFRYSNCVNNPNWQQYMKWVIRGAAEARFDGVFVDNAGSQRCYCKYCQDGFAEHLRSRYTAAELKALFGDDLSLSTDGKGLRSTETQIFWGESIHRFLDMIRDEGTELRGHFTVFPNGLQGHPLNVEGMFRDADLGMAENSVGTYGTNPGRTRSHVIAGIYVSHTNDNIFAHQISAACGAPCRCAMLTRPGYPKTDPAWRMNAPAAELGIAEAAAFSGGGCFLHDAPRSYPDLAPARTKYNAFFATHKSWYEGYRPGGSVGVLTMLSQTLTGDRRHVAAAQSLLETLLAAQVPADPVVERELSTDLSRYPVLIVPPVLNLPDAWVSKLSDYARAGGRLIISQADTTASLDHLRRARDPAAAAAFRTLGKPLPDDPSELLGPGGPLAGTALTDPAKAEALRTAVYVDNPTKPRRLTLHLVNYDVMLGVKGGQTGALQDMPIRLHVPGQQRVRKLTLASPGGADQTIAFKQTGDSVSFMLPRLDIYAICLLELEG
ncbi:MAG: beta-galactosidase trimerization domain-containing protein [Armatimonadetes bacterium]|nr:beta-galactosidase trimerization domain-containing protein [Armatimonadota bacterium]